MRRGVVVRTALAVAVALLAVPACATSSDESHRGTRPAGDDASIASIASITDGDTVRVVMPSGANEPVRLIGIDTPELRDPRRGVECFAAEATAELTALLPVGLAVNQAMVAAGFAVPYRVPPNVKHADELSELGARAREEGRGLWRACGGPDTPADAASRGRAGGTGTRVVSGRGTRGRASRGTR